MENNGVNNATYSSRYWFKPQIKRVKRGVQVDRHGYHIMKAIDFAAIEGFHFVPKTKYFEYCEDCCSIFLRNDQEDEWYQNDKVLTNLVTVLSTL